MVDVRSDAEILRDDITREVNGDALELAGQVFQRKGPDVAKVDNATLDQVYRQKFEAGDREWLQGEARRDPEQFLKVAERIGAQLPPTSVPGNIQPPPDAGAMMPAPASMPALPMVSPPPAAPPQLPIPQVPQLAVAPPPPTVPTVPQQLV